MPTTKPGGDHDLGVLSLLDEPVRRRLYDWVAREARPVGRAEAAEALGITRALATFHLDKLAAAGLLEAGYQRLSGRTGPGAGRPARVYWRARREFSVSVPERKYERAANLFASALEKMGDGPVPDALRATAGELGEALGQQARSRAGSKRLFAALEAGGYEPHADATGTVRLGNCPFDALAQEHRPLVCGTNLALAEGITRGVGIDNVRAVLDPKPGMCCVAFVPEPGADARLNHVERTRG
jgi:predicted ArsR family transcriptional regulator